jgi:hypothetical protein
MHFVTWATGGLNTIQAYIKPLNDCYLHSDITS